ncbi:hypothetical protein EVAR_2349_1 [Eumeta japonica]|uniref:Uncharacterized protein n=1 Tax=Eumeta variegata TaxID=151549 RepID=A0A4C1SG82_EUMVA|nr:hypothetical protein EVAR_2349_1 [Eumeta japonica]
MNETVTRMGLSNVIAKRRCTVVRCRGRHESGAAVRLPAECVDARPANETGRVPTKVVLFTILEINLSNVSKVKVPLYSASVESNGDAITRPNKMINLQHAYSCYVQIKLFSDKFKISGGGGVVKRDAFELEGTEVES